MISVITRSNAGLLPPEAMLCHKNLWMVERAFRTSKSLFATRPIFHKLDETIRGHVSCSFLVLLSHDSADSLRVWIC